MKNTNLDHAKLLIVGIRNRAEHIYGDAVTMTMTLQRIKMDAEAAIKFLERKKK